MTLHVAIPNLGKPKTVKDAIILILSKEWPLRAKEIYPRVKKHKLNVSYQAVHKELQWLLKNGILQKEHKSYSLNKIWIGKLKKFVEKLEMVKE
jgi:predicted transcriptional regulator